MLNWIPEGLEVVWKFVDEVKWGSVLIWVGLLGVLTRHSQAHEDTPPTSRKPSLNSVTCARGQAARSEIYEDCPDGTVVHSQDGAASLKRIEGKWYLVDPSSGLLISSEPVKIFED